MKIKDYQELSRRATKGDGKSRDELFAHGEELLAARKYKKAAQVFQDSAISYRISAYRNLAKAQDVGADCSFHKGLNSIYQSWIDKNPNGVKPLPRKFSGVNRELIESTVKCIVTDEKFNVLYRFLCLSFSDLGEKFIMAPGNTPPAFAISLINTMYGLKDKYSMCDPAYIHNSQVRICLDLIADEIEEQCNKQNS